MYRSWLSLRASISACQFLCRPADALYVNQRTNVCQGIQLAASEALGSFEIRLHHGGRGLSTMVDMGVERQIPTLLHSAAKNDFCKTNPKPND